MNCDGKGRAVKLSVAMNRRISSNLRFYSTLDVRCSMLNVLLYVLMLFIEFLTEPSRVLKRGPPAPDE